ncbi:TBC1 domain family member 1 [Chelonia mydas]|uniref:TBC1 domain family member 1 n=1 Tax=Chelonia mydas TaxID=8469 RepID=M7BJJ9_CHEMY|nr:TBC1 domain family member 1 [Chelonia mydas]
MPVLPWIVAEIRRLSMLSSMEESSTSQIRLYVSPASLRCGLDTGKSQQWDPLICSSLFEYKPQHVHKLIHNSHDPSYFACLIKDGAVNQQSICYVFRAADQTKVDLPGCEDGGELTAAAPPSTPLLPLVSWSSGVNGSTFGDRFIASRQDESDSPLCYTSFTQV